MSFNRREMLRFGAYGATAAVLASASSSSVLAQLVPQAQHDKILAQLRDLADPENYNYMPNKGFSGGYGSQSGVSIHNYMYTFGPVVSLRQSRTFTPFAHFLAGDLRGSATAVSGAVF